MIPSLTGVELNCIATMQDTYLSYCLFCQCHLMNGRLS